MAVIEEPSPQRQLRETQIKKIVESVTSGEIVVPKASIELPTGEQATPLATIGPVQRAVVEPAQQEIRVLNNETVQQVVAEVYESTAMENETYGEDRFLTASNVVHMVTMGSTSSTTKHIVWKLWNGMHWKSSTSATTTGYRILDDADEWHAWNEGWRITKSKVADKLWEAWGYQRDADYQRRYRRTPEEQIAWEKQQKEAREREEAERKARVAAIASAQDKAQKLLMSALNDKQKTELKTKGYFHCRSKKGVVYRIYKGTHGNVKRLDREGGKEIESLCIQPDNVPDFDAMLAQKLHIEFNEDDFRKTANIRTLN